MDAALRYTECSLQFDGMAGGDYLRMGMLVFLTRHEAR
jgi:hypothetical protein